MGKITKASFARAKRRLGIKKVTKHNIGRIAKAARGKITRKSKSRKRSNPGRSKTKTGGKTRMVRRRRYYGRKRRGGGGKSPTRGIFKILRLGALVGPAIYTLKEQGFNENGMKWVLLRYTGIRADGTTELGRLKEGWGPFIAVSLITHFIPKLTGLIRRL